VSTKVITQGDTDVVCSIQLVTELPAVTELRGSSQY